MQNSHNFSAEKEWFLHITSCAVSTGTTVDGHQSICGLLPIQSPRMTTVIINDDNLPAIRQMSVFAHTKLYTDKLCRNCLPDPPECNGRKRKSRSS